MITQKIFKEKNLISILIVGEVSFTELMEFHIKLANNPDYLNTFDGLVDQREAVMNITPSDLDTISQFNTDNNLIKGHWAHIIHTPNETALTMVYELKAQPKHGIQIFNTKQAASQYLGYDIREYLLKNGS